MKYYKTKNLDILIQPYDFKAFSVRESISLE